MFAKLNDLLPQVFFFRPLARSLLRRKEELPLGVLPELMAKDPEGSRGVAETSCRLFGRQSIDEIGPQRLVLTVS